MQTTEAELIDAMADVLGTDTWDAAATWLQIVNAIHRQRARQGQDADDDSVLVSVAA